MPNACFEKVNSTPVSKIVRLSCPSPNSRACFRNLTQYFKKTPLQMDIETPCSGTFNMNTIRVQRFAPTNADLHLCLGGLQLARPHAGAGVRVAAAPARGVGGEKHPLKLPPVLPPPVPLSPSPHSPLTLCHSYSPAHPPVPIPEFRQELLVTRVGSSEAAISAPPSLWRKEAMCH